MKELWAQRQPESGRWFVEHWAGQRVGGPGEEATWAVTWGLWAFVER